MEKVPQEIRALWSPEMEIIVRKSLDDAIRILKKKMDTDGLDRQIKIHQIPKLSERKKLKRFLSDRRRARDLARKGRREK